jgi:nucleoid DNA-binding protein
MSKSDIVSHMADKAGISKASAADALDAMIEAVEQGIKAAKTGESVRVPGLGTFTVRHRAARTGRNPRTGESIQIGLPPGSNSGFPPPPATGPTFHQDRKPCCSAGDRPVLPRRFPMPPDVSVGCPTAPAIRPDLARIWPGFGC